MAVKNKTMQAVANKMSPMSLTMCLFIEMIEIVSPFIIADKIRTAGFDQKKKGSSAEMPVTTLSVRDIAEPDCPRVPPSETKPIEPRYLERIAIHLVIADFVWILAQLDLRLRRFGPPRFQTSDFEVVVLTARLHSSVGKIPADHIVLAHAIEALRDLVFVDDHLPLNIVSFGNELLEHATRKIRERNHGASDCLCSLHKKRAPPQSGLIFLTHEIPPLTDTFNAQTKKFPSRGKDEENLKTKRICNSQTARTNTRHVFTFGATRANTFFLDLAYLVGIGALD
mgnify:CR=1 FL=1